jgi:hypothetical protein
MGTLDRMAMITETKGTIVNMYGVDGNSMSIVAACTHAMKHNKVPRKIIDRFMCEALSGDRQKVLETCDLWCTIVHVAPAERDGAAIGAFRDAGLDPEVYA